MIMSLNVLICLVCISLLSYTNNCKIENKQEGCKSSIEINELFDTNESDDCYSDTLIWLTNDSTYSDTILQFRNFHKFDSTMRISCQQEFFDKDCELLIWNNPDVLFLHDYFVRLKKMEFISYERTSHDEIVVHLFLSDIESKLTGEYRRFLVKNDKIIGINIFPGLYEEFIPYDEFQEAGLNFSINFIMLYGLSYCEMLKQKMNYAL